MRYNWCVEVFDWVEPWQQPSAGWDQLSWAVWKKSPILDRMVDCWENEGGAPLDTSIHTNPVLISPRT